MTANAADLPGYKDRRLLGALTAVTGWILWAYLRLRPQGVLLRHPQLLPHYDQWAYSRLAYSDIIALYHNHHLYLHLLPYIQNRIEYPVLMGLMMWMASFAPGVAGYFAFNALVVWLASLGSVLLLRRLVPRVYHWFAWTPLLLVYSLLNWDLIGIFLLIGGWYLYRQGRYRWAAAVFALGVFFKLFPIFLLPCILAELWRQRDFGTMRRMVGIFFLVSLAINLPFALSNFKYWSYFYVYNAGRGLGADIWANLWVHGVPVRVADMLSLLVVGVTALWQMLRVFKGVSAVSGAAMLFAVFLFVNKVFSPQYMIWMMAYAVLAEWPVGAYAVLALGGIVDYLNSFSVLFLLSTHSTAGRWYAQHLFPLGLLVRYSSLVAAAVWAKWPGLTWDPDAPSANAGLRTGPVTSGEISGRSLKG